jgi:hypothetical protein
MSREVAAYRIDQGFVACCVNRGFMRHDVRPAGSSKLTL